MKHVWKLFRHQKHFINCQIIQELTDSISKGHWEQWIRVSNWISVQIWWGSSHVYPSSLWNTLESVVLLFSFLNGSFLFISTTAYFLLEVNTFSFIQFVEVTSWQKDKFEYDGENFVLSDIWEWTCTFCGWNGRLWCED